MLPRVSFKWVVRLCVPLLVAAGVLVGCSDNDTSSGSGGPKSPVGFNKLLMPTFAHPRCINCHEFSSGSQTSRNHETRGTQCLDCHTTVPTWDAPGKSFNFSGLSSEELCRAIKIKFAGNVDALRSSLLSSPRLDWGISDGFIANLGSRLPTAPPGSKAAWTALVNQWFNNGAICD